MISTCEVEKDSKKYTGDYKTCYNHEVRHNMDWCCKAGMRCKMSEFAKKIFKYKFRVWVKDKKQMIYPYSIAFLNDDNGSPEQVIVGYETENGPVEETFNIGDVQIMQCLGKYDKEGRLIYEDDILRSDDEIDPYVITVAWDWGDEEFCILALGDTTWEYNLTDDEMSDLNSFTVVGNIPEDEHKYIEED